MCYEGRDPSCTTGTEACLACPYQSSGDAASSMLWEDSEPVHVPSPTIERSDERADNVALILCDKN
jgi:hypothetical protein